MHLTNANTKIKQLCSKQAQLKSDFYAEMIYFVQNCTEFTLRKESKHFIRKIHQILYLTYVKRQTCQDEGQLAFLLKQIRIRLDKIYKSQEKLPYFHYLLTEARKYEMNHQTEMKIEQKKININFENPPFIESTFEKNFYVRNTLFDCRALKQPNKEKEIFKSFHRSFSECPNCIAQFFYAEKINPTSFTMKNVIYLQRKEKLDYENFVEWICAILNQGGGVIFVGVNPQSYAIEGVHFTAEQFEEYKKQLKKKSKKIHPQEIAIKSYLVPIVKSPFSAERTNDNLCILRIFVKPKCGRKVFYYEKQRKPYLPDNNAFILDKKKEKILLKNEEVYKFLQKKYFQPKPYKSVHWNNDCQECEEYKFSTTISEEEAQEQNLNFNFKHQSMLMYGKGRQKKFEMFLSKMDEKLIKYSKEQPYIDLQTNQGNIYWLISHEAPMNDVFNLIPKHEKNKISLFSVKKGVELKEPIKQKLFSLYEAQFEKRFNGEKVQKKTYAEKKEEKLVSVRLVLKTLQEAIFTYIFMNVSGCRSIFEDPEEDKKGTKANQIK